MQLAEFSVTDLFNRYDHVLPMPTSSEDDESPSVVIVHGPNGVGKTTLLQMLDGMMSLNFDPFRRVPFGVARLTFNSDDFIEAEKMPDGLIRVTFKSHRVHLGAAERGAADKRDEPAVEELRSQFHEFTSEIFFRFLNESRTLRRLPQRLDLFPPDYSDPRGEGIIAQLPGGELVHMPVAHRTRESSKVPRPSPLGEMVSRFIRDAQVDYRSFFATTEPDLFPRILENLASPSGVIESPEEIEKKLRRVHDMEETHARLGLGHDRWDFDQLNATVQQLKASPDNNALAVLKTYTEYLESRADARQLVAERLLTFEAVMQEFFEDKVVRIGRRHGIEITSEDEPLQEAQLSSGEYQLLFLMVSALTTRRRGTVIAIDEPELSIHVAWQRRLVRNILRCASRATPQLILATHSPDIAADYADRMIHLARPGASGVYEDAS